MEKNFVNEFERTVALGLHGAERIGVALSGGADSVALLIAVHELCSEKQDISLFGLHCNFGLRADESDGDEAFCVALCRRLGVELRTVRFDVAASRLPHESLEMACRRLRYDWFEKQAAELRLHSVAIAHHREDAVETVLINMLRGTGPRGMRGMDPRRGIFVRPMLNLSRADIERYLAAKGVGYRTDSTNLTDDYRRNALRNTILPAVRQAFPAADAGIGVTMEAMRSSDALLNEYIGLLADACTGMFTNSRSDAMSDSNSDSPPAPYLDVRELSKRTSQPAAALFLAVPDIFGCRLTPDAAADCVAAATSVDGSRLFEALGGEVLELFRGRLMRYVPPSDEIISLDDAVGKIVSVDVLNRCEVDIKADVEAGRTNAYFDASLLEPGLKLQLRHWREGDRMRPFGMKGERKVSDIFSDLHLSASQKNSVWLLTALGEGSEHLLWVAGYRSSALHAVAPDCTRVLRISLL